MATLNSCGTQFFGGGMTRIRINRDHSLIFPWFLVHPVGRQPIDKCNKNYLPPFVIILFSRYRTN